MKKFIIALMIITIISYGVGESFALQQVAGKLEANTGPGQSSVINWGLISDNPSKTITVELYAEGPGSEFLSFPKKVELEPKMIKMIPITVSIPETYDNQDTLNPIIFAVEKGEQGGPTVINVQMKKILTLNIGSVESKVEKSESLKTTESKPEAQKQENNEPPQPICGPGTVLKDGKCVLEKSTTQQKPTSSGGCLIATATYGTELAPQVQFLREIRDSTVLSTASGSSFMSAFNDFYYSFSPTIADWERESPIFKESVKLFITPMITSLSIMTLADPGSEAQVLGFGISIIMLNIGMYIAAPTIVGYKIRKLLK